MGGEVWALVGCYNCVVDIYALLSDGHGGEDALFDYRCCFSIGC